jgi:ferrochelatase
LRDRMEQHAPKLPVYIGNRNWHPYIEDTLRQMQADGVKRAVAFFASGYSCYSGCRQYRENIIAAREAIGEGAPMVDKIRVFYNHPLFIQANADNIRAAFAELPAEHHTATPLVFTAHSIPSAMAEKCRYEQQLQEASRLTAEALGHENWRLVYQSRSGPPHQPWLEPDVCDVIEELAEQGVKHLVLSPIGFTSDHMEVLFDLDTEAKELCEEKGIHMVRAHAAGHHPIFVEMVHDLIAERLEDRPERPALGSYGASHDVCPENCCMPR